MNEAPELIYQLMNEVEYRMKNYGIMIRKPSLIIVLLFIQNSS